MAAAVVKRESRASASRANEFFQTLAPRKRQAVNVQDDGDTVAPAVELPPAKQHAVMSVVEKAIQNFAPPTVVSVAEYVLHVKTLTGKTISVSVNPHATVEALKDRIWDREGIPSDQQRLIYAGRQMEDTRLLVRDYGVSHDAVVHLVLRIRGGMFHESSGRAGDWKADEPPVSFTLEWAGYTLKLTTPAEPTPGAVLAAARDELARLSVPSIRQPEWRDVNVMLVDGRVAELGQSLTLDGPRLPSQFTRVTFAQ